MRSSLLQETAPLFPVTLHRNQNQQVAHAASYPITASLNNESELLDFLAFDHTVHHYSQNTRKNAHWEKTKIIPLDIDNKNLQEKDWLTPEDFRGMFPHTPYILSFSRNHMKKKNGESPRPKFHILFPLNKEILDREEYLQIQKQLQAKCSKKGIAYLDPAVAGLNQCFFGVENPEIITYKGTRSLESVLLQEQQLAPTPLTPQQKQTKRERHQEEKDRAIRNFPQIQNLCIQLDRSEIPYRVKNNSILLASPQEKTRFGYYILFKDVATPWVRHRAQKNHSLALWKQRHYPQSPRLKHAHSSTQIVPQYCSQIPQPLLFKPFTTHLITAETGMGKTTLLLEQATQGIQIFAAPSIYAVKALINKDLPNGTNTSQLFQFLYENKKYNPQKKQKSIICTYDKAVELLKHPHTYNLNPNEITVVFDEVHNIMVSGNFRAKVLTQMKEIIQEKQYKNVLLLSGTMDETDLFCCDIHPEETLYIERENQAPTEMIHIPTTTRTATLYELINQHPQQKIIVFNNNKRENEIWARTCHEQFNRKTLLLSAEKTQKTKQLIQKLLHKETIPENVDIVFMTCVGRESLNFNNENLVTIYLDKYTSALDAKQSSARARKKATHYLLSKPQSAKKCPEIPLHTVAKQCEQTSNQYLLDITTIKGTSAFKKLNIDLTPIFKDLTLTTDIEKGFVYLDPEGNPQKDPSRLAHHLHTLDVRNQQNHEVLKMKLAHYGCVLIPYNYSPQSPEKLHMEKQHKEALLLAQKQKETWKKEATQQLKKLQPNDIQDLYETLQENQEKSPQESIQQEQAYQYLQLFTHYKIIHEDCIETLEQEQEQCLKEKIDFSKNPQHYRFLFLLKKQLTQGQILTKKQKRTLINKVIRKYKQKRGYDNLSLKKVFTNPSAQQINKLLDIVCITQHKVVRTSPTKVQRATIIKSLNPIQCHFYKEQEQEQEAIHYKPTKNTLKKLKQVKRK